MAGLNVINSNRRDKKNKPKRMNLRVDFTPMVDMNMLLITFFMFCTTLSIQQAMDVVVPAKEPTEISDRPKIPKSKTITLILDGQNKVYYYNGEPDYKNYTSLKETDYKGLREVLAKRNEAVVNKVRDLKQKYFAKQITDKQLKEQISMVKKFDEGIIVLIKPTETSCYQNLVDAFDEMQICSIARYMLMGIEDSDKYLLENYKTKGMLTAKAEFKK